MKETCIEVLRLKYEDTPDWKLKKLVDSYSISGIMKNKGSKGTSSIIEIHDGEEMMLAYIKEEALSKKDYIKFNSIKVGNKVSIKGRVFKNMKNKLCLDVTYIERAN